MIERRSHAIYKKNIIRPVPSTYPGASALTSASLCGWGTERTSFMVQYGLSDVISLYALLKAFS